MIDVSFQGFFGFFCIFVIASLAGLFASRCLPWTSAARAARLHQWVGLGLGPFLVGLASVLALGLLPGAGRLAHLTFVVLVLGAVGAGAAFLSRNVETVPAQRAAVTKIELALYAISALWICFLLTNAVFLPLFQNDSLEYATVGRHLFENQALSFYPAIDPDAGRSGFYGPWTHPPLYVAFIYLSQVVQGHADAPGLMRLISPWFALAGAGVVYGIGCMIGRLTGAAAVVVFLSTPLFVLGADSALIDALPVLGFALMIAMLVGTGPGIWRRGIATGGALALSLWTHSQAFLFPFLALAAIVMWHGIAGWRRASLEAVIALFVAGILAAWPYIRNVSIFGSPISDTPRVFAAPELRWDEYFLIARGLDSLSATIQYGVFKGWFSFEAFGFSFWLMTAALVLFGCQLGLRKIGRAFLSPSTQLSEGQRALWTCSGLILTYIVGVALSVRLGSELVRNERYLLILMPAVATGAGFALATILDGAARLLASPACPGWKKLGVRAFGASLALLIVLQLAVVGWYYRWIGPWSEFDGPIVTMQAPPEGHVRFPWLLSLRPITNVMQYVAQSLPQDALILSLRPADMYYSSRRMISYLDPRMLAAYGEADSAAMADRLRGLGITHILIPRYYLPPINNSALQQVVASPELTKLEYAVGGTQLYALEPDEAVEETVQQIEPGVRPWTRYIQLTLGGRKSLVGIPLSPQIVTENRISEQNGAFGLFHRHFSTVLSLGIGFDFCEDRCEKDLGSLPKIEGGRQYRLKLDLKGSGFIRARLLQFDEEGLPATEPPDNWFTDIGDLALLPEHGTQQIVRRFETLPTASRLGVQVEHLGHSSVLIERATLELLGPGTSSTARAGR